PSFRPWPTPTSWPASSILRPATSARCRCGTSITCVSWTTAASSTACMRKLVLLLALLLAACGGSQSAPVVSPSAAAPNVKPAASGWQAEWDAAVAGATKEGKLVLSGPPSQVWRTALTSFEKDYPDVKIEYTGTTSRDFWPKIVQEQKAGQYLTDLRVGGPDPQVFQARDEGYLAQVGPTLIRPDVTDDSQWIGVEKGLPWGDKAKQ